MASARIGRRGQSQIATNHTGGKTIVLGRTEIVIYREGKPTIIVEFATDKELMDQVVKMVGELPLLGLSENQQFRTIAKMVLVVE